MFSHPVGVPYRFKLRLRRRRSGGLLRNSRLWKIAKFAVGNKIVRTVVRTKASFTVPATRFAGPRGAPPQANEGTVSYYFPIRP
jgi:hypothetical protein